MSTDRSFNLNSSHRALTLPAYVTISSISSFCVFKHLYLVWKRLSLSPNIEHNILTVSEKEISSGFFGKIKFVNFVFSSVPNFWSRSVIFSHRTKYQHFTNFKWSFSSFSNTRKLIYVRKNSSHSTVFFFLVNEFTEFVFRLRRQLIYPEVAII